MQLGVETKLPLQHFGRAPLGSVEEGDIAAIRLLAHPGAEQPNVAGVAADLGDGDTAGCGLLRGERHDGDLREDLGTLGCWTGRVKRTS